MNYEFMIEAFTSLEPIRPRTPKKKFVIPSSHSYFRMRMMLFAKKESGDLGTDSLSNPSKNCGADRKNKNSTGGWMRKKTVPIYEICDFAKQDSADR